MDAGIVAWLPAQEHHGLNTGDTQTHVLFVELKDPPAARRPGRRSRLASGHGSPDRAPERLRPGGRSAASLRPTSRPAVTSVGAVPATTPSSRARVLPDAVRALAVAHPRSSWLRLVAATVCAARGHRPFTAGLPLRGQCCRRCFTLRGEDDHRWAGA